MVIIQNNLIQKREKKQNKNQKEEKTVWNTGGGHSSWFSPQGGVLPLCASPGEQKT